MVQLGDILWFKAQSSRNAHMSELQVSELDDSVDFLERLYGLEDPRD